MSLQSGHRGQIKRVCRNNCDQVVGKISRKQYMAMQEQENYGYEQYGAGVGVQNVKQTTTKKGVRRTGW